MGIRHRPGRLLAPILSLCLLPAANAGGEPVRRLEIVDQAIAFHGGEIYRRSVSRFTITSKSGSFDVEARLDGGRYSFLVAGPSGRGRRRALVTNREVRLWEGGEEREVTAAGEQGVRDWVMARVYFAFLPFRLNDPSALKEDLGLEEWRSRPLRKVKVTFAPGSSSAAADEYLFWFDPESGRLEQFGYSFRSGEGGLRFRRCFNYRRVGGILFFDQENLGIDGPGLPVGLLTPRFVAEELEPVSTVRLEGIEVIRLEP